jgi:hypothetical protein
MAPKTSARSGYHKTSLGPQHPTISPLTFALNIVKLLLLLQFSRDISVSVAMSYGLEGRGLISDKGKRFFSSQSASYPVGTGGSFIGNKVVGESS